MRGKLSQMDSIRRDLELTITESLRSFKVDANKEVVKTIATDTISGLCDALRLRAREIKGAMSGMEDAAMLEKIAAMLEY